MSSHQTSTCSARLLEHVRRVSIRRPSINIVPAVQASPSATKRRRSLGAEAIRQLFPRRGSEPNLSRKFPTSTSNFLTVSSDSPSNQLETNHYKFLLDAFFVLLERELDLLFYLFPSKFTSLLFNKLSRIPLIYMEKQARQLCDEIRRCPSKLSLGQSQIFGLLSILHWFRRFEPKFLKLYRVSPWIEKNGTLERRSV